jgi:predicted ester cyclase
MGWRPVVRRLDAAGMTIQSTDRNMHNKDLVHGFIQDLFTAGDPGAVERYLDAAFRNHDLPFPGASDGRDGMQLAADMFRRACPDWHSDVDQLVAEDDVVVERFTASGTHRGELMGVAPTGRTIVLTGIQIFRIEGDKIVERWGQLDQLGLARQLGLAPS